MFSLIARQDLEKQKLFSFQLLKGKKNPIMCKSVQSSDGLFFLFTSACAYKDLLICHKVHVNITARGNLITSKSYYACFSFLLRF